MLHTANFPTFSRMNFFSNLCGVSLRASGAKHALNTFQASVVRDRLSGLVRYSTLLGLGIFLTPARAQVNITSISFTTVTKSSAGYTDSQTKVAYTSTSTTTADYVYNLVGNSSNPMFSIASGDVGASGTPGVIFRVRLGASDLTTIKDSGGLMVIVGIGTASANAAAGFGIMGLVTSDGTAATGSVWIMDSASKNAANTGPELLSALGTNTSSSKTTQIGTSVDALTDTSSIALRTTTNTFASTGSGTDTSNDAWLTFAVTYAAVNANTSSASGAGRAGVNFDASSGAWNFGVGVFAGGSTMPSSGSGTAVTGTTKDYVWTGSSTSLLMSDAIYTTGATSAVPEIPPGSAVLSLLGVGYALRLLRGRKRTK